MAKLLDGKRLIVTGGGRGLGLAIASSLVVDGARVVVVGRNEEPLVAAVGRLRDLGGVAAHCVADVRDASSAETVVDCALNELGGLDGLVNNAGVFVWKKFLDLSADDFDRTIGTNLAGPFYLSQAVARALVRLGEGGSIVNIASIHGKVPDANVVPHCASKFGLLGLTRSMAEALREFDIRVNAICPGAIQEDSADRRSETLQEKVTQADVATLVVYLASDLSRAVTGAAIDVYGSTRTTIKV